MNIYEKIQLIKSELNKANLKKSGENAFAHFKYYELADFLPKIVELCKEHKLMTFVSFLTDTAVLTAVNCENPEEQVAIYSPMKELELKGCNAIQALGGVETYQRRYLYMALFDIVENDMFDGTEQQENKKTATKSTSSLATAKEKLRNAMNAKVKQGMSTDEVVDALNKFNSQKRFTEYNEEEIEKALKFLEVLN